MSIVPESVQDSDCRRKARPRIRWVRIATICAGAFVLSIILLMYWWKPGLNASERRLIGVWTRQDSPGTSRSHFRDDGLMEYTSGPGHTNPQFMKWQVDADVISLQNFEQNLLKFIVKNVLSGSKPKPDQYPVTFNADGSITFEMPDGTGQTLIPWSSDQGEFLKQSE